MYPVKYLKNNCKYKNSTPPKLHLKCDYIFRKAFYYAIQEYFVNRKFFIAIVNYEVAAAISGVLFVLFLLRH